MLSPGSGLPANYSGLTGLRLLGLASMDLEAGPLPSSGLPDAWSALINLQRLDASNNRYLGGIIPQSWSNFSSIVSIDVSNTGVCGSIPRGLKNKTTPSVLPPTCELVNCRRYLVETLKPMMDSQLQPGSACNLTSLWPSSERLETWFNITAMLTTYGATPVQDVISFVLNDCYANNGNSFNVVLPSGLTCFSSLTELSFNVNNAAGTLPDEFTTLTQLQELWLTDNILTGSMKASYSALTALTILKLHNNQFTNTLPPEWRALNQLAEISISDNYNLNGTLPSAWGSLTSLTSFWAWGVGVGGQLPSSFSDLTLLSELTFMSDTMSGSLPSEWSTLTGLTLLNLASTRATSTMTGTIPNAWFGPFGATPYMSSLQTLTISGTSVSGGLPPDLSQVTCLTAIDFSVNKLTGGPNPSGFPFQYITLTELNTLNLADNPYLGGTVPDPWAASMVNLTSLDLSNTGVCAPFPSGLNGKLTPSTFVNSYCDDLPAAYNLVTNFKPLFDSGASGSGCDLSSWDPATPLCNNTWSGTGCDISPPDSSGVSFAHLTSLQLLNCITGGAAARPLPRSVTQLGGYLSSLIIRNSRLTGTLPQDIGFFMTPLTKLDFSSNLLTGELPAFWSGLFLLQELDVSGNRFINGSIPIEWGFGLNSLYVLNMGGMDQLTGPLPDSLYYLANLNDLTIESNSMTGTLPASWQSMYSLTSLVIGAGGNASPGPSINGNFPQSWFTSGSLQGLWNLRIANTKMTGPLPDPGGYQAANLGLTSLDLSSNLLSGTLPDSYQGFSLLQRIVLTDNAQLTGSIPTSYSIL
ncbi:hypothetical protein HYH02_001320 [Chlamydomonas schloesseri]|uniref:Uncharacterized protein n=1 Tax=Chlamydomonas schloesseri TaxID=2026947 RepID=A0A835WXA1_9CHLO|nr:hypothetical protein HYH02_001320 [Chlamydomonas schloesseri]|eukprot:KAG2454291.1 hypothetical protein HYH02_001320 [Chlamydomonas schloesseri]